MTYILVTFTAALAVLGWLYPESPPRWLISVAVALIVVATTLELRIEYKHQREADQLRAQVGAIHAKSMAVPKFELALNGRTIAADQENVPLQKDGSSYPSEFNLNNVGSAVARNFQVHLLAPEGFPIAKLGKHWRTMGTPDVATASGYAPLSDVVQYTFVTPIDLNPEDWLKLGRGQIDQLPPLGAIVPLRLKVSDPSGEKAAWNFSISAEQ